MWYNSIHEYIKQKYGMKLYKIALDAGRTCPNRDGTCGTRGCIFCSGAGSGEFAADRSLSITKQLAEAKQKIQKKMPKGTIGYIAYFQAFTNTYGTVAELEPLFLEATMDSSVKIISIATRPDCLSDEILNLLVRLQQRIPVWVELGLQTIHQATAEYIRRGYELSVYDKAVADLKKCHIPVITHVILGLPGETEEDMLATVDYVGQTGTQGIKLQLLHVLKGTDLAEDYYAGTFQTLELQAYINLLEKCVCRLPKDMVIHRLTGDGPKRLLVAPEWSGNKRLVMNTIRQEFTKRNVVQGSQFLI